MNAETMGFVRCHWELRTDASSLEGQKKRKERNKMAENGGKRVVCKTRNLAKLQQMNNNLKREKWRERQRE